MQRRVLNLGELNTTQIERWHRSIEVIEQEGQSRQYRLFTTEKVITQTYDLLSSFESIDSNKALRVSRHATRV